MNYLGINLLGIRKREATEVLQREACEAGLHWLLDENSPFLANPLVSRRLVVPVCLLFTRKPFKFDHPEKTIVVLNPNELSEIATLTGEIEFLELFNCRLRNLRREATILFAFDVLKSGGRIDPSNLHSRKKIELSRASGAWKVVSSD